MLALLVVVIGSAAEIPSAAAQYADASALSVEYKLKSVFLYKFATYVRWPPGAFAGAKSPFVIGILGPAPVGSGLRKIAAVKTIKGRKIEVRNFRLAKEVYACHILFISGSVTSEQQEAVIKRLSRRNILLVGETPDFLDHGGSIRFVIRENHVQFLISKSAFDREGLTVSAQLLRVAQVVP